MQTKPKAQHEEIREFIGRLNKKQRTLLRWLIFCYYNKVKCRGQKYLPEKFNKSFHFGYDFVWHEINAWPELIQDNDKSEVLQLKIDRHQTQFQSLIKAEPHEISYISDETSLESTLSELKQILIAKNTNPLIVGIELSPGHVIKAHRYDIECRLYQLIERTMFSKNENKPCFIRLTKFNNDIIVPYAPCRLKYLN